jgi:hypothetical protein
MKRTTISLSDELAAAVEREARRRRMPVSGVVREALEGRYGATGRPRKLPFVALGRSGHNTTARDAEEILSAEWATDIERDRGR